MDPGDPSIAAWSVRVPATVPVRSVADESNTALVLLAAMVKRTLRDPFENRTAGSSRLTTALSVNATVSVPEIEDCPDALRASATGACCVGVMIVGTPESTMGLLPPALTTRLSDLCALEP